MALEMEWTFEGSPEFEYGLTATAVVKRAAYMLVYEKSGPKGQVEWHRGYEIRLKHQILNRYLILGTFFIPKIRKSSESRPTLKIKKTLCGGKKL